MRQHARRAPDRIACAVQQGTINDILSFRLHDFPATISAGARDFVFAAMTRDPEARPHPKALLAHPWVTAYVTSVTNLLSGNKYSSTGELATEVVKVTGSSEIAVSMLRSIGSMQVRLATLRAAWRQSGLCAYRPSVLLASALSQFARILQRVADLDRVACPRLEWTASLLANLGGLSRRRIMMAPARWGVRRRPTLAP